ncbi:hypothetical protein [Paenibacillus tengchongensis]|uniref:hypothetical protein n=1 Tax=Paenibacillus tengchongensis TaxID=2608684 RepID=UPI00124F40D6|nr:hypothetical protein [Paenibacillus tengchongensis]
MKKTPVTLCSALCLTLLVTVPAFAAVSSKAPTVSVSKVAAIDLSPAVPESDGAFHDGLLLAVKHGLITCCTPAAE